MENPYKRYENPTFGTITKVIYFLKKNPQPILQTELAIKTSVNNYTLKVICELLRELDFISIIGPESNGAARFIVLKSYLAQGELNNTRRKSTKPTGGQTLT